MPVLLPVNSRRLRATKTSEGAPAREKIQALSCSVSDSRGNPARATVAERRHTISILHALGVWKVRLSRLWIWGLSRADAGLRAQLLAPSRGVNHLSAGCDAVRFIPASDMNADRCQFQSLGHQPSVPPEHNCKRLTMERASGNFQPTVAEVSSPGATSPQQWQGRRLAKVCASLPQDNPLSAALGCFSPNMKITGAQSPEAQGGAFGTPTPKDKC